MAAKKVTREEKVNFIKKNLKVFKPRSKADENKFNDYEKSDDKTLDILYKVIQGSVRRLKQREAAATATTEETASKATNAVSTKEKKNRTKKNDIFSKFGLDKNADLKTLNLYLNDANSLLNSIKDRIATNKANKKNELEKQLEKLQKELATISE